MTISCLAASQYLQKEDKREQGNGESSGYSRQPFKKQCKGPIGKDRSFKEQMFELIGLVIFSCSNSLQACMSTKGWEELVTCAGSTFTKRQKDAHISVDSLT